MHDYPPYLALSDKERDEFWLHMNAWSLSQFLHGEQGALLVASQLCSCAPTFNAKLYAASQTFDEARHVEVFNQYIQRRIGLMYPINTHLNSIIDKILTDPRWDLKFIGMQIVIEGLALSAFNTTRETTPDPVLKDIVYLVTRDEARVLRKVARFYIRGDVASVDGVQYGASRQFRIVESTDFQIETLFSPLFFTGYLPPE